MNSVVTKKGTTLPLVDLKGKKYLMVAHRLQWFNEEVSKFEINTDFLLLTDDQTVAKATVAIFNEQGQLVKKTSATKRETKKDFSDHTEKAETAAIGRCLAELGFGTQFALSDLDEGNRLADSPLEKPASPAKATTRSSFRKPTTQAAPVAKAEESVEGWE